MAQKTQQLNLVRTFNAPIEKVWSAWTTPEGWSRWYGKPGKVEKDSVSMDLIEGGQWKSTTVVEGQTMVFTGSYREIDKYRKLVLRFENPENPADENYETVTVEFTDLGEERTRMDFTQQGNLPPDEYEVGLREGWTGFFDALEEYVQQKVKRTER